MKILVTGAKGFVGTNLCENLKNIRDGKNKARPGLSIEEIYEYDLGSSDADLDRFCSDCDFVFDLAGQNRPKNQEDFFTGNSLFADTLIAALKKHNNRCPVMLSSSIQASLTGRFEGSVYGMSKKEGEDKFFAYAKDTGARVLVYRFPNLAGKWIRPNYNSAVATFCHNIANDLPITVNDPSTELELLFVEDLMEEMFDALEGREHRCDFDGVTAVFNENGRFCASPVTHKATLGYIVKCLTSFRDWQETLIMPEMPAGSFEKKLYSMYISYLPESKTVFPLNMKKDERGSFTEVLKTSKNGQFSVNITKPGVTKGLHWHNQKWEIFTVVSGHALIRERRIGSDQVREFEVSGEEIKSVYMLPGYTHSITNLSDSDDLVTLMWASEIFDSKMPDTFREKV